MSIFSADKAIEELAVRIGELDIAVRELKTANKHLELEWEELYDKVRRQMARMSKRYAVDQREISELDGVEPPDDGVDPISRSIMLRRGHLRKE